ncbi:MAG: DUF421 domain-containing protein [Acutalibacteraceae bacterium]|nr:DUF421 domain-containing protein [Acutalibacteraceae bacterium]
MTISVIRTLILYLIVLVMIRVMGKRQISELQTSELVVTLLISNIAVIPMQDTSLPLLSGVVPILLLVGCEIILSWLMLKNSNFRALVCGKPQIIISNGNLNQKKMKLLRISTEDLMEQLRQAGVFAISDVKYAILETNGKLSVLKKPEKETVTAQQMNIKNFDDEFEIVVISDGEIAEGSMNVCGVTKSWINKILKKNGIDVKDVFIMTANSEHSYNIIKKER